MGAQIGREHAAEGLLRRARGRAVVVGQVEMGDAEIERAADHRPGRVERAVVAEIVPEAQGQGGQLEAAAAASVVGHCLVAVGGGLPGHARALLGAAVLAAGRKVTSRRRV